MEPVINQEAVNLEVLRQYGTAEALERYLGSPFDPESTISFQRAMELDEEEIYPREFLDHLQQWNFQDYYIPVELGGKLKSYEEFLALGRVLARRDLSLAITDAHTFLGSVPVWISGSIQQKKHLAKQIKSGKAGCLAVTEKDHGSDLISNKVNVIKTEDGYLISGEKWPINKATMTNMLCVLAKTSHDENTSRSLSLFLVEKEKISTTTYEHRNKIKTLGIRGCDISGISFKEAALEKEALIGKEGDGLEITLKGFQITRTLCAGLSLGATDTALRTTLRFALERKLYGNTVYSLPHARQTLTEAFLDILISDCAGIFTARALHIVPEQFSVLSAIIKYFVPTAGERIVNALSVILGARFYLRETHDFGIFQKIVRDNSIISLFDGSTIINLHYLSLQLKFLAKKRKIRSAEEGNMTEENLTAIFSLSEDLPSFDYNRLDLFGKGNNVVLQGLELSLEKLDSLVYAEPDILHHVRKYATIIKHRLESLEASLPHIQLNASTPEAFDAAKEYCQLHAAAMCINAWIYNNRFLDTYFRTGEWLVLCLSRLLQTDKPVNNQSFKQYYENSSRELTRLFSENKLFSIIPFQLSN